MNKEYEDKAKALLRYAMGQRGADNEQLASRLKKMGIEMSVGDLENEISRGNFTAAFLLQCIEALDMHLPAMRRTEKQ